MHSYNINQVGFINIIYRLIFIVLLHNFHKPILDLYHFPSPYVHPLQYLNLFVHLLQYLNQSVYHHHHNLDVAASAVSVVVSFG